MILYHAFTTYHLLEFMVHKLICEPDKNAILIYPEILHDKYPQIESLEESIFFRTIQIYGSSREGVPTITNLKDFEKYVCPISEAERIYVAGAQNAFAFWLAENNISFVFFEEACGRLSRPDVIMKNDMAINMNKYQLALKCGMYTGENNCISQIICNMNMQCEGWKNEKAVHFDVIEQLSKLNERNQKIIKGFFDVPDFVEEYGVILLTQHFANLKMMTYSEQLDIYSLTVDYYMSNEPLYIKLHPDDSANYKRIFTDSKIINQKFPSELIPLIGKKTNKWKISSISSTGVALIKDYFGSVLQFNTEYEKSYKYNHIYFFILKLTSELYD